MSRCPVHTDLIEEIAAMQPRDLLILDPMVPAHTLHGAIKRAPKLGDRRYRSFKHGEKTYVVRVE